MIWRLARAIEYRDGGTGAHVPGSRRSRGSSPRTRPAGRACRMIYLASPLHDVGKIGVDGRDPQQARQAGPDELSEMRRHVDYRRRDPRRRQDDAAPSRRAHRPLPPRALGWRRVPRRPCRATPSRSRDASPPSPTFRRPLHRPAVQTRLVAGGGPRRNPRPLRLAPRPEVRRGVRAGLDDIAAWARNGRPAAADLRPLRQESGTMTTVIESRRARVLSLLPAPAAAGELA